MRPDDNWKESRIVSQDLSSLLDMEVSQVEEVFTMIEDLIIHRFIEMLNEDDDSYNKDYSIEIPYIGTLIISFNDKEKMDYSFVIRKTFNRKLRNAFLHGNSPLIDKYTKLVGDKFVEKLKDVDNE